jgi:phosphate transport system substrate-binding protein
MRMLAKDPRERPASAREVAQELEAIALGRDATARNVGAPRRLHAALPVAAGIVCLVGIGLWAANFLKNRSAVPATPSNPSDGERETKSAPARPKTPPANPLPVAGSLNAGGSTFIDPLMEKWANVYRKDTGIRVNYLPSGSGAGIAQMTGQSLDFCCSDVPMSAEQLKEARARGGEVLHIPLALGGIVPAYNVPNLTKPLRFSGAVLAGIYLGDITKWNDPALQELNPDVDLPNLDIIPLHRADNSGSTYIFTEFLGKVSKDWQKKVGTGPAVKWPVGQQARGTEGMVEALARKPGALAYVELLHALRMKLMFGAVKNKAGSYLQGSLESVNAAAESAVTDGSDVRLSLTYAAGKNAYPICGCTYAIFYVKQPGEKGRRLRDYLNWIIQDGQEFNTDLFYARLPSRLTETAQRELKKIDIAE